MTKHVKYWENRAGRKARTERAAQRTPLPPRGAGPTGNPTVEALEDELSKIRSRRVADSNQVGYPVSPSTPEPEETP